jgi:HPt (histidine-containing phosphotransfer) domain-containing protein
MLVRWLPAREECVRGNTVRIAPEQTPERPTPVFDSEEPLERLMGDRHMADIVLKGFLRDAPSQLDDLRQRLAAEDAAGARLRLHTLKGAAAAVAAGELRAVALTMEEAGNAGRWDRCRELLPRAVEDFERFRSALERAGWV